MYLILLFFPAFLDVIVPTIQEIILVTWPILLLIVIVLVAFLVLIGYLISKALKKKK